MRFPSIPNVAKSVRILSATLPAEGPVQLLVAPDGGWSVVPGDFSVDAVHGHCWQGVATVPGMNKQGRPRRFQSDAVARTLLAQARAQSVLLRPTPATNGRPVGGIRLAPHQTSQNAHGGGVRWARASGHPPFGSPHQPQPAASHGIPGTHHAVGDTVAFYGQVGRVVGETQIATTTGPLSVTLVEVTPVQIPAWGLQMSIAAVSSSEVRPFIPTGRRHPDGLEPWVAPS